MSLSGWTEENHEILSHGSLSSGRDLNPGFDEYEAGYLEHIVDNVSVSRYA
jgi:hypothetical protein